MQFNSLKSNQIANDALTKQSLKVTFLEFIYFCSLLILTGISLIFFLNSAIHNKNDLHFCLNSIWSSAFCMKIIKAIYFDHLIRSYFQKKKNSLQERIYVDTYNFKQICKYDGHADVIKTTEFSISMHNI